MDLLSIHPDARVRRYYTCPFENGQFSALLKFDKAHRDRWNKAVDRAWFRARVQAVINRQVFRIALKHIARMPIEILKK